MVNEWSTKHIGSVEFRVPFPHAFHRVQKGLEHDSRALIICLDFGNLFEPLLELIDASMLCHLLRVYSRKIEHRLVGEEIGDSEVSELVLLLLQELDDSWNVWVMHNLREELVETLLGSRLIAVLQKVLPKELAKLVSMADILCKEFIHSSLVLDGVAQ